MDTWRSIMRRSPFTDLRRGKSSSENLDRFIPNRSAMDMDYAHYKLSGGKTRIKDDPADVFLLPSREAYKKALAYALNMNDRRILAFKNKPPTPPDPYPAETFNQPPKTRKPLRHIPKRYNLMLDAPDLVDDFYLNLLDWGCDDMVAVGLGDTVHLWNASDASTSELVTVDEEDGPVTSISFAHTGQHVAVGLGNSHVQIWDYTTNQKIRTLNGDGWSRVNAMAWNNHILSTGGGNGNIVNNDVRVREHIVGTFKGHQRKVCGLKWSASGRKLASGGNDNRVFIWDSSVASSHSPSQWLNRFEDHTAAVKALAWCPFQANLLASGGGYGDYSIKFWNTQTGACLNSVDTGSQVTSLIWSKHERELLSSHGFNRNHLTLWKYPSMLKMAELFGHKSRILHMAQSPDGYRVATLGADEAMCIWSVFGTPEAGKPATKQISVPFANLNSIR